MRAVQIVAGTGLAGIVVGVIVTLIAFSVDPSMFVYQMTLGSNADKFSKLSPIQAAVTVGIVQGWFLGVLDGVLLLIGSEVGGRRPASNFEIASTIRAGVSAVVVLPLVLLVFPAGRPWCWSGYRGGIYLLGVVSLTVLVGISGGLGLWSDRLKTETKEPSVESASSSAGGMKAFKPCDSGGEEEADEAS